MVFCFLTSLGGLIQVRRGGEGGSLGCTVLPERRLDRSEEAPLQHFLPLEKVSAAPGSSEQPSDGELDPGPGLTSPHAH